MKEMSDADEYEARSALINRIVKIVSVVFVLWLVLEVFVDKYLLFKVEEAPVKVKGVVDRCVYFRYGYTSTYSFVVQGVTYRGRFDGKCKVGKEVEVIYLSDFPQINKPLYRKEMSPPCKYCVILNFLIYRLKGV